MTSITGLSSKFSRIRQRGFTLLELVLVMVIMTTVLAMAAPSLRGFFASHQTSDAATQIVTLARYAREQAMAEGRIYRLNFNTEAGTYWLTAQNGGAFDRPETDFGRTFSLPEGTTVEVADSEEETEFIPFYPDGRTHAAAIRLTGRMDDAVTIECRSPAEQLEIVSEPGGLY